jgi:hypothetical protein
MKTNPVEQAEAEAAPAKDGTKARLKWLALLVFSVFIAFATVGCEDYYYGGYPAYGRPYYGGGYGPYGPGYAAYPGYGPGSVSIEIGDRPYYTRGPGYYVGGVYYVWRPGHWGWRHGRRVWIHGHYVLRG